MTPDEPIFDKDRKCRKCSASAYIEYRAMRNWPFGIQSPLNRILRTCERCGHRWYELPLDHNADEEIAQMRAYTESRKTVS